MQLYTQTVAHVALRYILYIFGTLFHLHGHIPFCRKPPRRIARNYMQYIYLNILYKNHADLLLFLRAQFDSYNHTRGYRSSRSCHSLVIYIHSLHFLRAVLAILQNFSLSLSRHVAFARSLACSPRAANLQQLKLYILINFICTL